MNQDCIEKGCGYCTGDPAYCTMGHNLTKMGPGICSDFRIRFHLDFEKEEPVTYTKPPLGAPPAYIAAESRIKELADAISRASVEGRNYTGHITLWAKEIIMQCTLMDTVNKEYEGDE